MNSSKETEKDTNRTTKEQSHQDDVQKPSSSKETRNDVIHKSTTVEKPTKESTKLSDAVEEQKETMKVMKESYELQGQSLMQMQTRNAEIEEDMNRYLDIFRRHNLNQLAEAKPGLIENRINKGTADVFESIENDSKELDSLDNPSADINPSN